MFSFSCPAARRHFPAHRMHGLLFDMGNKGERKHTALRQQCRHLRRLPSEKQGSWHVVAVFSLPNKTRTNESVHVPQSPQPSDSLRLAAPPSHGRSDGRWWSESVSQSEERPPVTTTSCILHHPGCKGEQLSTVATRVRQSPGITAASISGDL